MAGTFQGWYVHRSVDRNYRALGWVLKVDDLRRRRHLSAEVKGYCHSRVRELPAVPSVVDELGESWIRVVVCFERRFGENRTTIESQVMHHPGTAMSAADSDQHAGIAAFFTSIW